MKIKHIYKKLVFSAMAVTGLMITSCNNDDDSLTRQGKPTLTLASNSIAATEGFDTYLDLKLSYAIPNDTQIQVEIIGGTATKDVDYTVNMTTLEDAAGSYWGTIGDNTYILQGGNAFPSYTDRHVSYGYISILNDVDYDPGETIELRLTSVSQTTALIDQVVTVTIGDIADMVPSTLDVLLDFDGSIDIDGAAFDKCGLDFDLLISDEVVATPYAAAFYTTNYLVCNETLSGGNDQDGNPLSSPINNDTTDWADGSVYSVYVDYWADNNASDTTIPTLPTAITAHEDIPMEITFTKVEAGVTVETTFSFPSLYNTADTTSENDPAEVIGTNRTATIDILGNGYIVTNLITGEATVML